MIERKVIQISTMVTPAVDNVSSPHEAIVALCDDGTLWVGDNGGWWQEIPTPGIQRTRNQALERENVCLMEKVRVLEQEKRDRESLSKRAE